MKPAILITGAAVALVGAVGPMILPGLPASLQSNPTLAPIGSFIIDQQNWISLAGLILILIALFL